MRASHVLSAVPGGPTYAIARNQLVLGTSNGNPTYSELTGPTFSPDGKVLFVNIQSPGITLAITGPGPRTSAEAEHAAACSRLSAPPGRRRRGCRGTGALR